ncbi:hypothetical protein [Enterobacter hormaechei]|uniref:hypothetical protein n=1 Tax=Enterobacter hormaechei TaxID=158836 RepID=UPI001F3E5CDE|nr:hypothetical protein [Enterobacter hormaechei]
MNHYPPAATSDNAADTANIRAFLQQAVDHYPRLVAFSFTLALPYRDIMTDYCALILRFHIEVWQRIGEYSWERQRNSVVHRQRCYAGCGRRSVRRNVKWCC